MGYYKKKWDYIIVERHIVYFLLMIVKAIFFMFLAIVFFYYSYKYLDVLKEYDSLNVIAFLFIFFFLNYSFLKLISYIISYYNNVIILYRDQIIIIKSSLILQDDMEIIDIYKIMKMDSFSRWFISNILGYWDLVIEQQKNDVRILDFISDPHTMLNLFKKQKEKFKTKKYVEI